MNYYLIEAIRMADAGHINQEVKDASSLLDWIREKKYKHIYPAIVYQNAPIRKLRTKKAAIAAIELLENHGWLIRKEPMKLGGSIRREVWEVIDV
jgi:hypothetical protein